MPHRSIVPVMTVLVVCLFALGACAPAITTVPAASAPQPTAAAQPSVTTDLTVFAAASLTDSFKEIAQQFEADHPGVKVVNNFAGSQALSTQLKEGAKADVFASANNTEMKNVQDAGLADNTAEVFVTNRLVVIVPADNPGGINELVDLAKPNLKLVMAQKTVPVGGYTISMLEKMSADADYGADFVTAVLKNVVSEENNVKAVVAKVALGEVDAGVVYVSDVTPDVSDKVKSLPVPDNFNQVARYPIVVLKNAAQPQLASDFVSFVLAADGGQKILEKWNFIPVK